MGIGDGKVRVERATEFIVRGEGEEINVGVRTTKLVESDDGSMRVTQTIRWERKDRPKWLF